MITAFDTTIRVAQAAIELGLDFESDSPVDIGATVTQQYGFKLLEWLDRVIATGNGSTEPEGILTAAGTTVVSSDNGAGGPLTVGDFEGLRKSVSKAFRNEPGAMCAYISNDNMYARARSIPVGPGDERRVFGMTHDDYMLLNRPYKVQNDIADGRIAFGNLKRYRMYRRLGLQISTSTEGRTLMLANKRLIVLRARFGGKIETGGAFAVTTDAHA